MSGLQGDVRRDPRGTCVCSVPLVSSLASPVDTTRYETSSIVGLGAVRVAAEYARLYSLFEACS